MPAPPRPQPDDEVAAEDATKDATEDATGGGGRLVGRVADVTAFPVKGLGPRVLDRVVLAPGRGVPDDRLWALARADGRYRPGADRPLPKNQFHVLVRDEVLARLRTRLDGTVLTLEDDGAPTLRADLATDQGRAAAGRFVARVLGLADGTTPVVAHEPGLRFTDAAVDGPELMEAVSLLNLASVADLAARAGSPVDPLRFRANVHLDGPAPFAEAGWVGRTLRVGGARLEVVQETGRCAATEVEPGSGRRDLPVPRLLREHYGHARMGVYALVRDGGVVRPGDPVVLEPRAPVAAPSSGA
ncbi:MOSC domain-containing protein [Cellulomonas endophytica]|uniref:MOSC domain-containing protein n=1 Tax=Cellulomonas endophytica TaxID=2494735 RepID=UPI00196A944C|nr:MOSC domain-containing protein [Cellulomonas endophytica]